MFDNSVRSRFIAWISALVAVLTMPEMNLLRADLVVVQNSGFENVAGSVVFNEFTFGPPVGWQIYNPNGIVVNNGVGPQFWVGTLRPSPPTNFFAVPEGQRVAILFNEFGTGNLGEYGLSQTLAATLQANTRYTLEVDIGNIASGTALNGQFFNLNGFPGYRVDLLAGGVVIASDNNSLAGSIPEGEWGASVVQFETTASHLLLGQALGIRLVNLNQVDASAPTADLEVDFDRVRLSATAVPEPSSVMMVGLVFVTGISMRRRRVWEQ
ncbi:MAG: PEP-CTERM sorting domain-containing protein [Planctomycetaceae bacterium]|nr:PEP-CTERM sorting domain-containing protein [Planctomycetaceae bacterium]